jgi:hypothetical protein
MECVIAVPTHRPADVHGMTKLSISRFTPTSTWGPQLALPLSLCSVIPVVVGRRRDRIPQLASIPTRQSQLSLYTRNPRILGLLSLGPSWTSIRPRSSTRVVSVPPRRRQPCPIRTGSAPQMEALRRSLRCSTPRPMSTRFRPWSTRPRALRARTSLASPTRVDGISWSPARTSK